MPNKAALNYDVVVIGGGMAGLTAALSSGSNGAKTLLVERHPYCGGAFTAGMVLHIAALVDHRRIGRHDEMTLDPKNWIVRGLACEYHKRLSQYGAALGPHWDHEPAKVIFDQMLNDYGVDVLYGTQFYSADVHHNQIDSVELIYRTTKLTVTGKTFIDASGDGDLGAEAGVEFHFGRESDGKMSPGTLSYMVADYTPDPDEPIKKMIVEAIEKGELPEGAIPGIIDIRYSEGKKRNELWCSAVRQWGNYTDPIEYSRMESRGRSIGWEIFRFLKKNTKSFRDAYLGSIGQQIWPREGRHFKTEYQINASDVRGESRFDDVIARGAFYLDLHSVTPGTLGWDIDEHRPVMDTYFEIPYRALLPEGVDNLLFAGRTVGADHEGHSATRVMGTGIATGEAAGTASALAVKTSRRVNELDAKLLQQRLREQGVII